MTQSASGPQAQQTPETSQAQQEVQQQAGKVLAQVAGYVGIRTIDIGLRTGLLVEMGRRPDGITPGDLAARTGTDPTYVEVWCRSAYAAEVIDQSGDGDGRYRLAPHMDQLLLNPDFPGYLGGLPSVLLQPEVFDQFAEKLPTGERTWWNNCSQEFIRAVSQTGRPFYTRLIPAGLSRVPGLQDALAGPVNVLELACGVGVGLERLAKTYPSISLTGVDGDAYSLSLTEQRLNEVGIGGRVNLLCSPLEEVSAEGEYDVALINISMHECRDIEEVTRRVHRALRPGGHFVISDFPFPESAPELRTAPARVMCGIQFFEALIDDQLLPTSAFLGVLERHGFREAGSFDITPVHAVTYGRK